MIDLFDFNRFGWLVDLMDGWMDGLIEWIIS